MEKEVDVYSEKLPVMEAFYTIQGEGFFSGHAAFFIRLGGCDVGCVWCDVKESWPMEGHRVISIGELVKMASSFPSKLVVVTGGEPFMHNLDGLTRALKVAGFRVNVETAGTHPISGQWDWICLSPKKFVAARDEYFKLADEIKIIVYNKSDLSWSGNFQSLISHDCRKYLQPEWSNRDKMMQEIVEFVKNNPTWEISLQTHKYLDIP